MNTESTTRNGVQFSFMDIDCVAVKECYRNSKATALRIIAANTENNRGMGISIGEPVATASINMEYYKFDNDEVAVKTYSENHGLLPILIGAKIVTLTDKRINSPYGLLPVVAINCDKLAEQ
jgi:hypothetical protein